MDAAEIEALLTTKYLFHCREAGVRMRDDERDAVDVVVGHLLMPPYPHPLEWAPPSLQTLYSVTDGAALFCPEGTTIENVGANYGLVLHQADDVLAETEQISAWLLEDLETLRSELADGEFEAARRRITSFAVIGTVSSGDPIVVDRSTLEGQGEPHVVILDHELLLAAVMGVDGGRTHADVLDLLSTLHLDALTYLEDSWRYFGPDGRQYFVESIEHVL